MVRIAATLVILLAIAASSPRRGLADGAPAPAPPKDAAGWAIELKAKETDRRRKAAYALWGLGPAAKDAIPSLAAALRDEDEYVRTVADKVLTTFRMEKAVGALEPAIPELLAGLEDSRVEVRRLASGNLWRIGWPMNPPPPSLAPALMKAFKDPDAAVRARAAGVVVNYSSHVAETYDALKPLAADPDAGVRLWSLQALATLQPVKSSPLMLAALSDTEATVRTVAATNLGFPSTELAPAVPKLVTALVDPDADVRRAAAYSLGGLGQVLDTSSAVDRLLEMLKDPDPTTEAAAASGLEGTGATSMIAPLLVRLDEAAPPDVRAAMVSALGNVGPEQAHRVLGALEAALQHDDESVQTAGATAIRNLGYAAAAEIPALLGAIGDPTEGVRVSAISAVIAVGGRGEDVVDKLRVALKFGSLRVRNATSTALVALGAQAKDAGPLAIDRLRDEQDAGTRSMLLQFLSAIGAEPGAVLEAALAHPPDDPGARVGTSFARARFSSNEADVKEGVARLIAAIDPDQSRWQALYALRLLGRTADAAIPKIEEMARAEVNRMGATETFDLATLQIRGVAAKEAWARLRAGVASEHSWSAAILGELGATAEAAVPDLVAAAGSKSQAMRREALIALGKIGVVSDAVKATLDTASHDPIASVRRATFDARSRLGLLPK